MSKRAKWKILVTDAVGEERGEVRRRALAGRDLDDIGVAVAGRKLDEAEPVAERVEPERLGVDRDRAADSATVGRGRPCGTGWSSPSCTRLESRAKRP